MSDKKKDKRSKKDKDGPPNGGGNPTDAALTAAVVPGAKLPKQQYEQELIRLQVELTKLQDWVRHTGQRIVVVFEGRDAAGKGGVIKRITERVSPRVFRVVALPAPSDRERTQLYLQRYIQHLPAAGEVVLFDRSWYNRLGVERVMGYCTDDEYERFRKNCRNFEYTLVEEGIKLFKYWLSVSNEEQEKRFEDRINDPLRQWKLSPMDLESRRRWYDYSLARDAMLEATDTPYAPWYIVNANDKRRARLNCIAHLLSEIPYQDVPEVKVKLPKRDLTRQYDDDTPLLVRRMVPEKY
ncbi:MAG: polyphosphate kinase 2 [Pirellulaceae bacterium]|nr:polyphosphate kinase 2 [Pirellulaceae bacterium]